MVGSPTKPKAKSRTKVITGTAAPVTRTKTGCLTCRQRKKKCDEKKPSCGNCLKANYECEPCPPPKPCPRRSSTARMGSELALNRSHPWISGSAGVFDANTTNTSSGTSGMDVFNQNLVAFNGEMPGPGVPAMNEMGVTNSLLTVDTSGYSYNNLPLYSGSSSMPAPTQNNASFSSNFGDGIETIYTPLGLPQQSQSSQEMGSGYFPGGYHYSNQFPPIQNTTYIVQTAAPFSPQPVGLPTISVGLPCPIPGVRNGFERNLLHHFTTNMAHVLTTSGGGRNAMNHHMIPLATEDPVMMSALLSLSGAHVLNQQDQNKDHNLAVEERRLYFHAVHQHEQRTRHLLKTNVEQRQTYSPKQLERLFATSLLLCLHGICAGSEDHSTLGHLNTARQLLKLFPFKSDTQAGQSGNNTQKPLPEVNSFLLEFFLYHDVLATVTMPVAWTKREPLEDLDNAVLNDVSLVGVNDGLMHFTNRIASLREQTAQRGTIDGVVLIEAHGIHRALSRWKANASMTPDQIYLAELFRIGLSIWLFSITKPRDKADPQIQDLVHDVIPKMSNLSDNIKACLLFPLFIIGGAAIAQEDKDMVVALFKQLKVWSSLNNIDSAQEVVKDMWKDHDEGRPDAWDWVARLIRNKKRLLVT